MDHTLSRSRGLDFQQALSLVETVCEVAGSTSLIADAQRSLRRHGVVKAVRDHDDSVLFRWLMEGLSYQGVSDAAAATFMADHGVATAEVISDGLSESKCPRLVSYWSFNGCGYRKTTRTCNEADLTLACPLPHLDMRNGSLSRGAYSLWLFMRDVAGGDLVAWIDRRLEAATTEQHFGGYSIIEPLSQVQSIGWKTLNMVLATLLLGADPKRPLWQMVGADMVAIDTLVHAFFHRTGILRGNGSEHPYGPACYAPEGCADIVRELSSKIDGKAFNIDYPIWFPRFVQHAIWRFCAQQQINQCNGNRINDTGRCNQSECILYDDCARLKLGRLIPAI